MPPDPADSSNQPKPLPYQRTRREDGAAAMKGWDRTRVDGAWRFAGACPRCTHRTEKDIPDSAVVLKLAVTSEPPAKSQTYVVECDCKEPHTDRPDGAKGCGAFWGVEIRSGAADDGEA